MSLDRSPLSSRVRALRGDRGATQGLDAASAAEFEDWDVLRTILDSLRTSGPGPEATIARWLTLEAVFGLDRLALLCGTSSAAARRHRIGELATPPALAQRLGALVEIAADLARVYERPGVCSWFERSRASLDGLSASAVLACDWDPGDSGPSRVREFARALRSFASG